MTSANALYSQRIVTSDPSNDFRPICSVTAVQSGVEKVVVLHQTVSTGNTAATHFTAVTSDSQPSFTDDETAPNTPIKETILLQQSLKTFDF